MKTIFKKIIVGILNAEAKLVLKKYKPFIIAVTGSVGKTSTKDAIYSILASTSLHVRKSEKSFNSEIGVPLTILGAKNAWNNPSLWIQNIFKGLSIIFGKNKYPDCLVLEIGADHPGDIRKISEWLKPDIAVITKISNIPVHVEFFPSPEALMKEKFYLAKALKKDGVLILSEGETKVKEMAKDMKQKCLTFGLEPTATVSASHDFPIYDERDGVRRPVGMSFKMNYGGNSLPINIKGAIGIQHIYPLIAAATVGIAKKILLTDIVRALDNHIPPRGRMNLVEGINESVIIDDTYNSSPDALREALLAMQKIESSGKKIAVLGDMLELGKYSAEEHRKAGALAKETVSVLVTVGQRAKMMGEDAVQLGDSSSAGEYIKSIIEKGDIVLIKGSQSMRMERTVKAIMKKPEEAEEILVRHDPEWLAKK